MFLNYSNIEETKLRHNVEAVARRCSAKKAFFKISQNSQENTVPESLV